MERRLKAEHDDWLDECSARQWIVRAVRVRHVDAPSNPYLSFAS